MDYLYYIFGALIFAAVVLLISGAYLTWDSATDAGAERVARRLRALTTGNASEQAVSITKARPLSANPRLQALLEQLPHIDALDRLLLQSGHGWNCAQFLGMALAASLLCWLLGLFAGLPLPFQLLLGAGGAALPLLVALRAKAKRLACIEQQLPDGLDMMARAMRAGHAFPTALKMIADEMSDPIAGEFRAVFDEVNFGVAMSDALMNLAVRVPSTDLRYFVVAVLIQRETGGNLSELLASIGAIIRDRIKLMGQVRVLSAEGKMSAWVLGLLPLCAGAMMQLSNPEFLALLYTDPAGRKMIGMAGLMMLIGILAINRIVRIRV